MQLMSLNKTIVKVESDLHALKDERMALEKKVVMLRPGTLDDDLLEERVRAVLGYRHPQEWAVTTGGRQS